MDELTQRLRIRGQQRALISRRRKALAEAERIVPVLASLMEGRRERLADADRAALAEELNRRELRTARGSVWRGDAVERVLSFEGPARELIGQMRARLRHDTETARREGGREPQRDAVLREVAEIERSIERLNAMLPRRQSY